MGAGRCNPQFSQQQHPARATAGQQQNANSSYHSALRPPRRPEGCQAGTTRRWQQTRSTRAAAVRSAVPAAVHRLQLQLARSSLQMAKGIQSAAVRTGETSSCNAVSQAGKQGGIYATAHTTSTAASSPTWPPEQEVDGQARLPCCMLLIALHTLRMCLTLGLQQLKHLCHAAGALPCRCCRRRRSARPRRAACCRPPHLNLAKHDSWHIGCVLPAGFCQDIKIVAGTQLDAGKAECWHGTGPCRLGRGGDGHCRAQLLQCKAGERHQLQAHRKERWCQAGVPRSTNHRGQETLLLVCLIAHSQHNQQPATFPPTSPFSPTVDSHALSAPSLWQRGHTHWSGRCSTTLLAAATPASMCAHAGPTTHAQAALAVSTAVWPSPNTQPARTRRVPVGMPGSSAGRAGRRAAAPPQAPSPPGPPGGQAAGKKVQRSSEAGSRLSASHGQPPGSSL